MKEISYVSMIPDERNESRNPPIIVVGKKPAIRYVEARRIGTCAFADRIATLSIQHYKEHIDETIRTNVLPQTCIATIVAAFHVTNPLSLSSLYQQQQELEVTTPPAPIVDLKVLAMGVGTKFLSEQVLKSEQIFKPDETNKSATPGITTVSSTQYGTRIRDCHAEVLCRRAFRKYLFDCIEQFEVEVLSGMASSKGNRNDISILERYMVSNGNTLSSSGMNHENRPQSLYQLRPDVSLHMYCSSTPCGNSTIKKFATLQKEIYCTSLPNDVWPSNRYNHLNAPVVGHSIPLGQLALLVKKDNQQQQPSFDATTITSVSHTRVVSKKEATWPIYNTTDWCPPGTTTVWSNQGSIHTCSDKIARWNYLGYQGALLSSFLKTPIYISTITVGRKFSSMTCRRAVCCRLDAHVKTSINKKSKKRATIDDATAELTSKNEAQNEVAAMYQLHHPVVMGTSVYMDDNGFIDMSEKSQIESNDMSAECEKDEIGAETRTAATTTSKTSSGEVRFLSSMSFVTWLRNPSSLLSNRSVKETDYEMECIDGSTGLLMDDTNSDGDEITRKESKVCSYAIMNQFLRLNSLRKNTNTSVEHLLVQAPTLLEYRKLKRIVAWPYEHVKDTLLTKHPVLRDWKRRSDNRTDDNVGSDKRIHLI